MQELIPAEPGVQETFCKRWQKATASNDYFQILWRGGGGGSAICAWCDVRAVVPVGGGYSACVVRASCVLRVWAARLK